MYVRLAIIASSEDNYAGSDRRSQLETVKPSARDVMYVRLAMIASSEDNYAGSDRRLQLETVRNIRIGV